jgi:NNP family nitrate/nitrite transporter-like MFS transporter
MSQTQNGAFDTEKLAPGAMGAVVFLTGIFLISFTGRMIISPMMPVIELELGFSHTQAGLTLFAISLGYFASLLLSGLVSFKLDHHRAVTLAAFCSSLAMLIIAMASNYTWLVTGAFLAGASGGIYFPSGMATITSLVPPTRVGWVLGIHEWAPTLALVLAPLAAEAVLLHGTWRAAPMILCGLTMAAGLVFFSKGPGRDFKGTPMKPSAIREVAKEPLLWGVCMVLTMGVATGFSTFTMLPLYLVFDQGMERTTVNLIISMARFVCIGATFMAGMIADRMGATRALALFLSICGVLSILMGLADDFWIWVLIFLQPIANVCVFAPSFAILSLNFPKHIRNVAVATVTGTAMVLGSGIFPTIIGYLGENGYFGLAFCLLGICTLCVLPVLIWLDRRSRDAHAGV